MGNVYTAAGWATVNSLSPAGLAAANIPGPEQLLSDSSHSAPATYLFPVPVGATVATGTYYLEIHDGSGNLVQVVSIPPTGSSADSPGVTTLLARLTQALLFDTAGNVLAEAAAVNGTAFPNGLPANVEAVGGTAFTGPRLPADVQSFVGDTGAAQAAEICYGILVRRAQVVGGYYDGDPTAITAWSFDTTLPVANANHYQGQAIAFYNSSGLIQECKQIDTSSTVGGLTNVTLKTALTQAPNAGDWFAVLGRLRQ
jgi:hypothetical protein